MTAPWSFPWTDTTDPGPQVGDGRPFTAEEWALYQWLAMAYGSANAGVLYYAYNLLAVTVGGANLLNVDTGVGMAAGRICFYDAVSTLAPVSAGPGLTRKDAVIIEADFNGSGVGQYKCRVSYKQGTAGAYPAMTQNLATVYQVLLYYYTIDDAGAITGLIDQRTYWPTPTAPSAFLEMTVLFGGTLGGSDGHRPVVGGIPNETWHLANGELVNGVQTVDSRDRVPIGAGSTYAVGATGGATTHTHGVGSYKDSVHRHGASTIGISQSTVDVLLDSTPGLADVAYNTHVHTLSGNVDWGGNNAITGTSASGSSLPPYTGWYFVTYVGV